MTVEASSMTPNNDFQILKPLATTVLQCYGLQASPARPAISVECSARSSSPRDSLVAAKS